MEINVMMVRHGETVANRARILQGHRDYQLNTNGRLQAKKAGHGLESKAFDRVYTSTLSRAYETADIILQHNPSFRRQPCPVERWEILKERTFGKFEGRGIDEFNAEASRELPQHMREDLWQHKPQGGESLLELRARAGRFFDLFAEDLSERYFKHWSSSSSTASSDDDDESSDEEVKPTGNETPLILVVAHGVLFKELMIHLAEERHVAMPCPGKEYRKVSPNAGITRFVLTFHPESGRLQDIRCPSMFDVAHLGGMETLGIEEANSKSAKPVANAPVANSSNCREEVRAEGDAEQQARAAVKVR